MARVVEALETDYAAQLRRRKHRLLGAGTVNVGTIAAARQPNIVPDACTITVDRRLLPGETEAGVKREIAALLRAKKLAATISSLKTAPCLPLERRPGCRSCKIFSAARNRRGQSAWIIFATRQCWRRRGIPSVVFGPGDIAQAHTADEWISLAELERAKDLLVRFFQSLA